MGDNKMISKLPWTLEDSAKILSADGDIVAEDYTFKNMDDFEAICDIVNLSSPASISLNQYLARQIKPLKCKHQYRYKEYGPNIGNRICQKCGHGMDEENE